MIRRTSEGEQGHSGRARHAPARPAALRVSGPVEGFGVGEHAAQPGLVSAQDADLEVRLPFRPGRGDLVDGAELESEPAVVPRVAEQGDKRLAEASAAPRMACMSALPTPFCWRSGQPPSQPQPWAAWYPEAGAAGGLAPDHAGCPEPLAEKGPPAVMANAGQARCLVACVPVSDCRGQAGLGGVEGPPDIFVTYQRPGPWRVPLAGEVEQLGAEGRAFGYHPVTTAKLAAQ